MSADTADAGGSKIADAKMAMFYRKINLVQVMTSYNTVALVAFGAIQDYPLTASLIKQHHSVIAVDGGLNHCVEMGIVPDLLVGDLDSVSKEILARFPDLPTRRFPTEKDETDLELALQGLFTPDVAKVTVYGALEKRVDHTLANLNLISRYPGKVFLENERELLFALNGSMEIPCHVGQTVSFMALGATEGISTEGLKWELRDATFSKYFFSLSNVCLHNKIKIKVEQGDLLCCLQK